MSAVLIDGGVVFELTSVWLLAASAVVGAVKGFTDRWRWWQRMLVGLPLMLGIIAWMWSIDWAVRFSLVVPLLVFPTMWLTETLVQPVAWRNHPKLGRLGYWARMGVLFRTGWWGPRRDEEIDHEVARKMR